MTNPTKIPHPVNRADLDEIYGSWVSGIGLNPDSWLGSAIDSLLQVFIAIPSLLEIIQGLGVGQVEAARQAGWLRNPTRLPEYTDALVTWRRGDITDSQLDDVLRANGFTQEWADALKSLTRAMLSPEQAIFGMWRGVLTEQQVREVLARVGYEGSDVDVLLQQAQVIPPITDLITMAVREVFSLEQRAASGLDIGYPEILTGLAAKQGLSEEWARNYWAAHWRLPSVQQGYEMLHRGVIDLETLRALIKALDVAPGWIDRLIEISYRPFTRVDVRRMYSVGILDREGVKRAYLDLGYNDEKAEALTEFTVISNAETDPETAADLKGLTRATVIKMLRLGLLDERDAIDLLRSVRIGEEAARAYVDIALAEMDIEARQIEIDRIVGAVKSGEMTETEALDAIERLDLSEVERLRARAEVEQTIRKQSKLPTADKIVAAYKRNLITDAEAIETLRQAGYSERWSEILLKL